MSFCDVDRTRVFFLSGRCQGQGLLRPNHSRYAPRVQWKLNYNRCGETSERQRTAVPVVYGIECSVMMKLKLTDEAEVCQFTSSELSAPNVVALLCGDITLFGGMVSVALSGGVVNSGHV